MGRVGPPAMSPPAMTSPAVASPAMGPRVVGSRLRPLRALWRWETCCWSPNQALGQPAEPPRLLHTLYIQSRKMRCHILTMQHPACDVFAGLTWSRTRPRQTLIYDPSSL